MQFNVNARLRKLYNRGQFSTKTVLLLFIDSIDRRYGEIQGRINAVKPPFHVISPLPPPKFLFPWKLLIRAPLSSCIWTWIGSPVALLGQKQLLNFDIISL